MSEPAEGYMPGHIVVVDNNSKWNPYKIIFIKSRFQKAKNKKKAKWWYNMIIVNLHDDQEGETSAEISETTDTWTLMDCKSTSWYARRRGEKKQELDEDNLKFIIKYRHPSAYIREYLETEIAGHQEALALLDGEPADTEEEIGK